MLNLELLLRFETPPGRKLQIDFGQKRVSIGGVPVPVFLFVATLGYSRLLHVQPFHHERQSAWLASWLGWTEPSAISAG